MDKVHERLLAWQRRARLESAGQLHATVHSYCRFMAESGVPFCRVTLALTTLHPQIEALRYVWYDDDRDPGRFPAPTLFRRVIHRLDGCTIDEALMAFGAKDTEAFRRSPFYRISLGAPGLAFPLERGRAHEFPILDDLADQGATHYVAYPLPGMGAQISLVTRLDGGFDAERIRFIELSLPVLSLLLESALKDLVLDTVLQCYVGALPGEEIKRGNIRPGVMLDLGGAIWFSDIRGYSTQSQNTPPDMFIHKLNDYYECLVPIIYAHGGEVLKFIGDAVLAIFASDSGVGPSPCKRALAAALAVNQALVDRKIEFDHGIGLHVGRFQFGNIGSLRRLDFTVIGNEVNVAARIEAQCGKLGQRILMSRAFLDECAVPANCVAEVALKGIEGQFGLFAPGVPDELPAR